MTDDHTYNWHFATRNFTDPTEVEVRQQLIEGTEVKPHRTHVPMKHTPAQKAAHRRALMLQTKYHAGKMISKCERENKRREKAAHPHVHRDAVVAAQARLSKCDKQNRRDEIIQTGNDQAHYPRKLFD